jgi:hypothetical protein
MLHALTDYCVFTLYTALHRYNRLAHVPVPLHLYAELAKTDIGCSILSEHCNIKLLLSTLINSNGQSSNAQNSNVSAGKQCVHAMLYQLCTQTSTAVLVV